MADLPGPWASKGMSFWRLITETDLNNLGERILDIFLGRPKARMELESCLLWVSQLAEQILRPIPPDLVHPASNAMEQRGGVARRSLFNYRT